ncbi:phage portal protein [Azospirillum sp. B510]|uniref:phage portal protein n=1 Tax=Azospirillum sp. (strain B510) TaxID=137722 RepID=UPI0005AB4B8E|nr:phage portal protein [Azospirillum sp. B510]
MIDALKRVLGLDGKRSLDAASVGRRLQSAGRIANLNTDLFHGAATIRQRAAHMARNNPWVAAGVAALVGSTVGTGIVPTPRHADPVVRDALSAAWLRWTDVADISGRQDFQGLQALVARSIFEAGEAFVRLRVLPEGLRLELVPAEMVPIDLHRNLSGGGVIRAGVEFDADGRVVAFHVYRSAPSDPLQLLSLEPIRIAASELLHIFEPLVPGQVRGLSRIAAVMLRALDLDGYEDAALLRMRISNLLTGFVSDPDDTASELVPAEMLPGAVVRLPPGAEVTFSDPPDAGASYADYVRAHLRALASGLGTTYEQISADFSSTNYSSARAAQVEHRRKVEQFQHSVLAFQFLRPVWSRFVTVAVLTGEVPAAALDEPGADWLTPRFEHADPKTAVETEVAELDAGLRSRSQSAAERGIRIEDLDAQIAADRAREKQFGLTFGAKPPAQAAPTTAP